MAFKYHGTQRSEAGRKIAPLWPVVLVVGAFAAGSPAQSEDGLLSWIVKSVSTDEEGALIEASLSTPQAGVTLIEGQRISTGPGQQMVLSNGRDLVTLNPGTSVEIGDNDPTTAKANLELDSGTVHVKAGKRTQGHTFSVETAYLVATVKGTQFDVSTSEDTSAVSVTEGVVGVQATVTHQSVDVTPGKTAIVDRLTQDLPNLIDSPAGGAATVVGAADTETASAEDGAGVSGTGDIGSADASDGSNGGSGGGSGGSSGGGGSNGGGSNGGGSGGSGSTGGSSGGSTGGLGGAVGAAGGAVGGAVSGASGAVGGAVSDTSDAVGGAVSGVTDAVGGAIGGRVGGTVSDAGGAVGGAVSDVGGAVGGAVGGVGGAVGGAVGGLAGGLGGALGGLGRGK